MFQNAGLKDIIEYIKQLEKHRDAAKVQIMKMLFPSRDKWRRILVIPGISNAS